MHFRKNLRAKLKISAPAIFFVGDWRLSVGTLQLPAPTHTFLTDDAAGLARRSTLRAAAAESLMAFSLSVHHVRAAAAGCQMLLDKCQFCPQLTHDGNNKNRTVKSCTTYFDLSYSML